MAEAFTRAGIPSVAVSGETRADERAAALRMLKSGDVNCVFAVDLFNEGIDVPAIDTVLFLRPTESATVFLQQLGRGLRQTDGKACLTVLDFIGQQHRRFRFDRRFRALLGSGTAPRSSAGEQDFPLLPSGCHMQLDRVAREAVLRNLRTAIGGQWAELVHELREIRRRRPRASISRAPSGRPTRSTAPAGAGAAFAATPAARCRQATTMRALGRALNRMLHIDDQERLEHSARCWRDPSNHARRPSASGSDVS